MALILASQRRGITKDITILDAAGAAIVPASADKIRASIGRETEFLADLSGSKLTLTSDAATANGSSFTKNSPSSGVCRLRLDASDLTFDPGVYTLLVDFYDSNDTNEWKCVGHHIFILEPT